MKNYLLLLLLAVIFIGCGGSDGQEPPPGTANENNYDDTVYKTTGCKVNNGSSIMSMHPVFTDESGNRYLTGSINANGVETFWIAKFKSNGDCIWETIKEPASAKGYSTRGVNPIFQPNGNIVLSCTVFGSSILSVIETVPTIINAGSGLPTFVRVKEGYKYVSMKVFEDFFICEIPQGDLDIDPTAYPWAAQISNDGKILLSAASFNTLSEYSWFINTGEFVTVDDTKIERSKLAKVEEGSPKWTFGLSLPEYKSYEAEIKVTGADVLVNYMLTLPEGKTKRIRYKLDVDSGEDYKLINDIQLETASLQLQENDTYELQFSTTPFDAADQRIKWTSSDETVATVNDLGLIMAKKAGKCVITATSAVYNDVLDNCELEVISPKDDILFIKKDIEILKTDEHQLVYKVYPVGTTHDITWESADPSIASVDQTGKIKGLAVGKTRIKASIKNGEIFAECEVDVVSIKKYVFVGISISGGSIINGYASGNFEASLSNGYEKPIRYTGFRIEDYSGTIIHSVSITDDGSNTLHHMMRQIIKVEFNLPVYYPKFIWTYTYNGETYEDYFSYAAN